MDDPQFLQGIGADQKGGRPLWEVEMRKKYKIAQRQFDRLLEMLLLKQLDRKDQQKTKAYRLHVKARLYRFNYVSPLFLSNHMIEELLADRVRKCYVR